jgi:hypothetical protein
LLDDLIVTFVDLSSNVFKQPEQCAQNGFVFFDASDKSPKLGGRQPFCNLHGNKILDSMLQPRTDDYIIPSVAILLLLKYQMNTVLCLLRE